jgi:Polyphosphate kinase 2 (PPK2)
MKPPCSTTTFSSGCAPRSSDDGPPAFRPEHDSDSFLITLCVGDSRAYRRCCHGLVKLGPLKQWKLSPINRASIDKWDDYTEVKETMFFYTDTADAPWTVVKADDKKRARALTACSTSSRPCLMLPRTPRSCSGPDPLLVGTSAQVIGRDEHIIGKAVHPITPATLSSTAASTPGGYMNANHGP